MEPKSRVLIIDDEQDIREGVSRWLNAAGFETTTAQDGRQGCERVTQDSPRAIVLDVQMPNMDGMQTLSALRSNQATVAIPVVVLSASLRDEQRALDAGASFFVRKPYDGRKLVCTVQAALARHPDQAPTPHTQHADNALNKHVDASCNL
jgi:DNA-binding response OmpR family regulator